MVSVFFVDSFFIVFFLSLYFSFREQHYTHSYRPCSSRYTNLMSERNIENNIDKNQHTVVPPMHDKCSGVFYNIIFLSSFIYLFFLAFESTQSTMCAVFFPSLNSTHLLYFIYLFVVAVVFGFVI